MNLEQREGICRSIQKQEGHLTYAVQHKNEAEADRLRAALRRLTERI